MSRVICANCGTTNGPYIAVFQDAPKVCKNTKQNPDRVTACVERRRARDTKQDHKLRSSGVGEYEL